MTHLRRQDRTLSHAVPARMAMRIMLVYRWMPYPSCSTIATFLPTHVSPTWLHFRLLFYWSKSPFDDSRRLISTFHDSHYASERSAHISNTRPLVLRLVDEEHTVRISSLGIVHSRQLILCEAVLVFLVCSLERGDTSVYQPCFHGRETIERNPHPLIVVEIGAGSDTRGASTSASSLGRNLGIVYGNASTLDISF